MVIYGNLFVHYASSKRSREGKPLEKQGNISFKQLTFN